MKDRKYDFPEKRDMPKNYKTRLEYMKKNDLTWHFNPKQVDRNSAKKEKQIQISHEETKQIEQYSKSMPLEIGASIYRGEQKDYEENELVWRKLDHIHHGYNKENTRMYYKRTKKKESPTFLQRIIDKTELRDAYAGVIRLEPGNVIPWHYDSYIFSRNESETKEPKNFERHIIFPLDWDWGHIYQIGNNVISNWTGGARYSWPNLRYHLAANVGIVDFVMIAVTGTKEK